MMADEAASERRERVYLIGFMGSGKSTIGPILANTLGYDFVDVDRTIEETEGKSVSELFRLKGEEHFRVLEREIILQTCTRPRTVISLGGGAVVDEASFQAIKKSGILVYLKLTPEQIYRRMRNKVDRPMLMSPAGERLNERELRIRIQRLFSEREPIYAKADLIIATDENKVGITVDRVVKRLSALLR
jgi:shikimate kinase